MLSAIKDSRPRGPGVRTALVASEGAHLDAIALGASAAERLGLMAAVDARSDEQFVAAFRLADLIDRSSGDPAIKQLAKRVKARIVEGLRLDTIDGQHAAAAGAEVGQIPPVGRRGVAACEAGLTAWGRPGPEAA